MPIWLAISAIGLSCAWRAISRSLGMGMSDLLFGVTVDCEVEFGAGVEQSVELVLT